MSTDSNAKSIIEQPVPPQFGGSFHDTEGARARLTPGELMVMNLDSQGVAAIALGARPHLERIRPQIVTQLPHFDIARFDKIGTFAEALFYANVGLRAAPGPGGALVTVMARAGDLLDRFLTDTPALEKRGLIDGAPLREIKRSPGYLNTATELGVVVRVLRADWPKIVGKTAIEAAELDEAEAICERLTLVRRSKQRHDRGRRCCRRAAARVHAARRRVRPGAARGHVPAVGRERRRPGPPVAVGRARAAHEGVRCACAGCGDRPDGGDEACRVGHAQGGDGGGACGSAGSRGVARGRCSRGGGSGGGPGRDARQLAVHHELIRRT